jgi:hypothetical protein
MADGSEIEWTEATWNPTTGCDRISPGLRIMTTKRLACLTALAVAGVTACGGDEEAAFDGPRAIADEIGCEYEGGSDELFVKEGGSCGDVAIHVFKDNATRD